MKTTPYTYNQQQEEEEGGFFAKRFGIVKQKDHNTAGRRVDSYLGNGPIINDHTHGDYFCILLINIILTYMVNQHKDIIRIVLYKICFNVTWGTSKHIHNEKRMMIILCWTILYLHITLLRYYNNFIRFF